MTSRSIRTIAVLATAATVGGAAATTATTASAATDPAPVTQRGLLDGLLPGILPTELGTLLTGASGGELTTILGTVTDEQLTGALGTLLPAEIGGVLTSATGGDLTTLLGGLPGGELTGVLDTLTTGELQTLLGQVTGDTALKPVADQITQLLLGRNPAGGTTAPATTTPPGPSIIVVPVNRPGAAPTSTRYRARVSSARVAKNRRSMSIKVTCPAAAPKGCLVRVSGQLAGKRAMAAKDMLLLRNTSKTVRVKLVSSATKRLRKKGGTLRLSARTVQSTLGTATKSAKVAKPKRKRAR